MGNDIMYVVGRCRMADSEPYGKTHLSGNGDDTLCGIHTSERWWIYGRHGEGHVPDCGCTKCLLVLYRARALAIGTYPAP